MIRGVDIENPDPRLQSDFFLREDVVQISRDLLGKRLCTRIDGLFCAAIIVETEAYKAPLDKASHAYGNRRTARTEVMFHQGGKAYVYLCYGIHHLFNIVTGPESQAHAVLIRAVEPVQGIEHMLSRRKLESPIPRLTAGPGILSKAMGITTKYSGLDLVQGKEIWLEDHSDFDRQMEIIASPRVGVDYAEECAAWPWRFRIKGNKWTSPAK